MDSAFAAFFTSPMHNCWVGSNSTPISFHVAALTSHCQSQEILDEFNQPKKGLFKDVDAATFMRFLEFAYTGSIFMMRPTIWAVSEEGREANEYDFSRHNVSEGELEASWFFYEWGLERQRPTQLNRGNMVDMMVQSKDFALKTRPWVLTDVRSAHPLTTISLSNHDRDADRVYKLLPIRMISLYEFACRFNMTLLRLFCLKSVRALLDEFAQAQHFERLSIIHVGMLVGFIRHVFVPGQNKYRSAQKDELEDLEEIVVAHLRDQQRFYSRLATYRELISGIPRLKAALLAEPKSLDTLIMVP